MNLDISWNFIGELSTTASMHEDRTQTRFNKDPRCGIKDLIVDEYVSMLRESRATEAGFCRQLDKSESASRSRYTVPINQLSMCQVYTCVESD